MTALPPGGSARIHWSGLLSQHESTIALAVPWPEPTLHGMVVVRSLSMSIQQSNAPLPAETMEHMLSRNVERDAALLAPRTFQDYVRLLGGKVSTLKLELRVENPNERWLTLKVDGGTPYGSAICTVNLLDSTRLSGDFHIFTCACGHAGCNRIYRGVRVVHEGACTLWKAYYAKGRKLFLFDREQYRAEILRGCTEVVDFLRESPENFCSPVESPTRRKWLERAYFQATGG
ncbi:hypothetical protein DES53_11822 [Roseimicrobium gellanilyticum]|uniref:Uncharacterized protein n=1 Tax=Roseimicrobium gellanilyticum TaxID=748857 RepID=A0A366H449_9BACT|nr:hypothetical protein [Roseimicrobium gellanilyticum]RBP36074.1 hypothetical protein DES53_11822 [Roseimicrobium gellanilyticum]